jgi:hypothetical protein
MARYARDYSGERRTVKVTVQLTPSERSALEEAAARAGASLSQHARELCLRRSPAASPVVAGTRRSPDAKALANHFHAIGNNLNQLTHLAQIHKATPQLDELKATTDLLKTALSQVIGG